MRRFWRGSAVAAALTAALVIAGGAAPANADSYPSWDDVQAAKNNATAAQAEVDRINGLLQGLQTAANAAGDLAVKRLGEYGAAEAGAAERPPRRRRTSPQQAAGRERPRPTS